MISKNTRRNAEVMGSPVDRKFEMDIVWILGQVYSLMNSCVNRDLTQSPLTPEGLWFLTIIQMLGDDATPVEVAKWMVRKQNSVSDMLKRLEEKGYINRLRIKSGSKNQIRILLTEEGRHVHNKVPWPSSIQRTLSCLSAGEKQQFRQLLCKLRKQAALEARNFEEPPYPHI